MGEALGSREGGALESEWGSLALACQRAMHLWDWRRSLACFAIRREQAALALWS